MRLNFGVVNLGCGRHHSIPKAGLIWWKRHLSTVLIDPRSMYLTIGDYGYLHEIVEIAGANHCGPATASLVSMSFSRSVFWHKRLLWSMYPGIVNARINAYSPSDRGLVFINELDR